MVEAVRPGNEFGEMKTLLVLRHAKSSWKHSELADHDRPLNERGRRDAPRVGMFVTDAGLVPDLILSSTAKRARSTAEEVAACCAYDSEVVLEPRLYLADPTTIVDIVQGLRECIRVRQVRHMDELQPNPMLSRFVPNQRPDRTAPRHPMAADMPTDEA